MSSPAKTSVRGLRHDDLDVAVEVLGLFPHDPDGSVLDIDTTKPARDRPTPKQRQAISRVYRAGLALQSAEMQRTIDALRAAGVPVQHVKDVPVYKLRYLLRRRAAATSINVHTPRRTAPRARGAGRPRARPRVGSRDGPDSDSDDPEPAGGRPPPHVRGYARRAELRADQLRWCRACGLIAFAIDTFQRRQLDALGFCDDPCPSCRRGESR